MKALTLWLYYDEGPSREGSQSTEKPCEVELGIQKGISPLSFKCQSISLMNTHLALFASHLDFRLVLSTVICYGHG